MLAMDYEKILDEYRTIWNNRRLQSDQSTEDILKEAIQRDLKDENSHPRARRTLMEKYYLATKRILEASLTTESKIILLQLHMELVEAIQDETGK
ncbi:hypothetical protein [Mesobacillus selenatarsenatis]|uniref:YojE n=1 Tax=Mesobacillus selenatarsenatis (strain DSM 18680 / JCM 14380 / FERM P-15431 / SF-1) TaxID=1321606 RepID=A0A0A8XCK3_MESS1|nr:hypothetical protein [Mesobacillus selenatarsenatis]GAM16752.1 hypothetical protein SAMD00020551_4982 [Mesobacillus selenatarsenatis SF-1]